MGPFVSLAPISLAELSEKDLQRQVFDLLALTGFGRVYHTFDSRRSAKGFPDIFALRERAIMLELKREKGKLTPAQKQWLADLASAGLEVYLIRPRDLDALAVVLAARSPFDGKRFDERLAASRYLGARLREEIG